MFRLISSRVIRVVSPVCMLGGLVYFGVEDKKDKKEETQKRCVTQNIPQQNTVFRGLEFQLEGEQKLDPVPPSNITDPKMKTIDLFITPVNQDVCQSEKEIQKLSIKLVPKRENGINITAMGEGDKGPYLLECKGSIRTNDGIVAVPLIVFLQEKWAMSLIHHTLEENMAIHKKHLHSFGLLSFYGIGSRPKTEDKQMSDEKQMTDPDKQIKDEKQMTDEKQPIKCRYDAKSKGLKPVDRDADSTIIKR